MTFLDATTWLAQIAMFVLFGLLAWPDRLPDRLLPALGVALVLMLIARPAAVFLCLAPFRFSHPGETVHLLGRPARRRRLLSGVDSAAGRFAQCADLFRCRLYRGAGVAAGAGLDDSFAARRLRIAKRRPDVFQPRIELDLPGQRAQELVGYQIVAGSPYLRSGIIPPWAKLALVVRHENVMTPEEARGVHEGDHVYLLAPQEKAQALDRFFADLPPPSSPDPHLLGDFFVGGDATLGGLAEIYGLAVEPDQTAMTVSELFAAKLRRAPQAGDVVRVGTVALVAHRVSDDEAVTVGLQLAEAEAEPFPKRLWEQLRRAWARSFCLSMIFPKTGSTFGIML